MTKTYFVHYWSIDGGEYQSVLESVSYKYDSFEEAKDYLQKNFTVHTDDNIPITYKFKVAKITEIIELL